MIRVLNSMGFNLNTKINVKPIIIKYAKESGIDNESAAQLIQLALRLD